MLSVVMLSVVAPLTGDEENLKLLYLYDKADGWGGVLVVVEVCSDQTILGRMVENA
jgi:hypothetical protein